MMLRTMLGAAAAVLLAAACAPMRGGQGEAAHPAGSMPMGAAEHAAMHEQHIARVPLASEDRMIPSDTPGIELFVRNKRPAGMTRFAPERTVLYVHGSTYPAETAFDLPLAGVSWMDYLARHGYDVWLVDLRGYGRSTRPPEMDRPAAESAPLTRTEVAVRDVASAVEFIRAQRGVPRLNLLGWSWGTTIMGAYAARNNAKVEKLVLYAPQWVRQGGASLTDAGGALGGYRVVSIDQARARWLAGVPEDKKASLIPAGWFEQWAEATFDTDPWGRQQSPKKLRAPNGTVQDSRDYWGAGKALYDPGELRVPTLLVHAEWDADLPSYMAHAYFAKLTNVPYKRFVEIGEGTHTVIMEKNRLQLFQAVQQFLDERVQPER